jgi:DNA-binding beta-propeller fold protein YncE
LLALAAVATAQLQSVLTIDASHRLIEGVASDGSTIWVSSVLDRQILACRTTCRRLATLPAGLHPFAIAWDGTRRRLWVAADCPSGVVGIKPCDRGALIGFTAGGRLMTRVAPLSGSFHPGDVSAGPAGVFVSDSQNGAVYGIGESGYGLTPLIPRGIGKSVQGSAVDADGNRLLVSDYSQGVAAVDLASGARTILPRQDGKPLRGVDGVARCGPVYYGIYNGSSPGALLSIAPAERGLTYEKVATLADPTQIVYDGKRLLIVSDSGWASIEKPTTPRASGATVLALPLSDDCKPQ